MLLKYFLSGGRTDGGINTQETSRKDICRWNFNATSIENIKSKIDETISINGWIVFYIHGAEAPNNLSKLDEVITYIKSKGNMEIVTYDEAFERMFGRKLLKEKLKTLLGLN